MFFQRLMMALPEILRARSSNADRDQHSGVQAEGMISSIHSSPSETNVSKFCMSMGLVIGTNIAFLQLKRNSFDEVLTCIEILMFFIGLMIFIFRHAIMSSTCSRRRSRDVLSWILYWIPNTCAPLVAIPMISFCIAIGEAIKITILIIGYIVLVATNFNQLRSDVMYLFLHPVDRTSNVIDQDHDKACAAETQNAAAKGKDQILKGHFPMQTNGVRLMLHV
ncbi:hypothetical protein Droror1_Dr00005740 [Drosera rotundifolia]